MTPTDRPLRAIIVFGGILVGLLCLLAPASGARIINGQRAPPGQWPYTVSVYSSTMQDLCGGTLIAPNYVLTAAHCVLNDEGPPVPKDDFAALYNTVYAGGNNPFKNPRAPGVVRKSVGWTMFPKFNLQSSPDDIAIIELKPADNPAAVPIVRLASPAQGLDVPGTTAYIAGWGSTKEAVDGVLQLSDWMLYGTTTLTAEKPCLKFWDGTAIDFKKQICSATQPSDTCQGDSGGPLYVLSNKQYYQIGVTSFGDVCGGKARNAASISVRLGAYIPWICSVTKNLGGGPNAALCSTSKPTRTPSHKPTQTPTRKPTSQS